MEFLDKLPYPTLIIWALFLGLAPFFPIPHLFEKLIMLKNGTLHRPLDIFDLIMHASPIILIGLKFLRGLSQQG